MQSIVHGNKCSVIFSNEDKVKFPNCKTRCHCGYSPNPYKICGTFTCPECYTIWGVHTYYIAGYPDKYISLYGPVPDAKTALNKLAEERENGLARTKK